MWKKKNVDHSNLKVENNVIKSTLSCKIMTSCWNSGLFRIFRVWVVFKFVTGHAWMTWQPGLCTARIRLKGIPAKLHKRQHRPQVGTVTISRSCTTCLSLSASGCCLQHMFQDFKLLMLSKFVIASSCLRLVVIVLCLVSANFKHF